MKLPDLNTMPILGGGITSVAYGLIDTAPNSFQEITLVFFLSTIIYTLFKISDSLKEANKHE